MNGEQQPKFVKIPAPPDLFGQNATITRRYRVPLWRMDGIRASSTSGEVYNHLAALVPEWENIRDVETDAELPHPQTDSNVFGRLDAEQLGWISETFKLRASDLKKLIITNR